MVLLSSTICKIGGRDYNQDYAAQSLNGVLGCFVVCDGLGSYAGSEVASKICATKIVGDFNRVAEYDPSRAAKRNFCKSYLENAHHYVVSYKERNPKIASSCTTAAVAATDGKTTTFAHIGDTRIYFFKKFKLAYQSKDHSLSQLAVEMGHITTAQIRTHKDQNKLTRVIGSEYYGQPDVETVSEPLAPGDAIILCTDGFWEYVLEDEMEHDLASSKTPGEALQKMEARLLKRVDKFNDNYTATIVMMN
ncbi:MAG: serine/threonine-protein phosphatase [Firmicutes bacterium]|nr:serine/threonine-protein phosphatase [Bacillota bacterium]